MTKFLYSTFIRAICIFVFLAYAPAALLALPYAWLNPDTETSDVLSNLRACYGRNGVRELWDIFRNPGAHYSF